MTANGTGQSGGTLVNPDIAVANILLLLQKTDEDTIWYWRQKGGPLDEYLATKKSVKPESLRLAITVYSGASDAERRVLEQRDLLRRMRSGQLDPDATALLEQIQQSQEVPEEVAAPKGPSFLERNGLVDKQGRLRAGKLTTYLCVILLGPALAFYILPGRSWMGADEQLKATVQEDDWATESVRTRHIKNLRGVCTAITHLAAYGDRMQADLADRIAATDKYLAEIQARDPDFRKASPDLYREFLVAKAKYDELHRLYWKGPAK